MNETTSRTSNVSGRGSTSMERKKPTVSSNAATQRGCRARLQWRNAAVTAALVVMCALQLAPFWIALTTGLKPAGDPSLQAALPFSRLTLENFHTAAVDGGIVKAIFNSAVVTVFTTVLTCLLGAFAAYPLARRPSRINSVVLAGIVALIMIPPLSILVPLYTFVTQLGGTNTY